MDHSDVGKMDMKKLISESCAQRLPQWPNASTWRLEQSGEARPRVPPRTVLDSFHPQLSVALLPSGDDKLVPDEPDETMTCM